MPEHAGRIPKQGGADFAYLAASGDRFRVNVFDLTDRCTRRFVEANKIRLQQPTPDVYRQTISDTMTV